MHRCTFPPQVLKLFSLVALLFLSQCSYLSVIEDEDKEITQESRKFDKSVFQMKESQETPDWMEMKGEGIYKLGKPYKVNGMWYFPKEDAKYDEIGIASWYGPGFHQKITANGEYFDMDLVTGAHKTLPLPSVVRVTNLENGRSLLVRINDRGPFVNDRIIDLSRKAADLLGFIAKGTAKVRVELMSEESMTVASQAQNQFVQNTAPSLPAVAAGAVAVQDDALQPFAAEKSPQTEVVHMDEMRAVSGPQAFVSKPETEDLVYMASSLADAKGTTQVVPMQPSESRPTDAAPAALTNYGKSFVQVGAFCSLENVKKVIGLLEPAGKPNVETLSRLGQTIYRVRFGPFEDVAEAQKVMDKILNIGHGDVQIVVE